MARGPQVVHLGFIKQSGEKELRFFWDMALVRGAMGWQVLRKSLLEFFRLGEICLDRALVHWQRRADKGQLRRGHTGWHHPQWAEVSHPVVRPGGALQVHCRIPEGIGSGRGEDPQDTVRAQDPIWRARSRPSE